MGKKQNKIRKNWGPPDYPDRGQPQQYPHLNHQQLPQPQDPREQQQYSQGGYVNWVPRPYQPQQQQQHLMDENSSSAGNGLARSESGMSEKPLSDEECRELERRLAQEGHSSS